MSVSQSGGPECGDLPIKDKNKEGMQALGFLTGKVGVLPYLAYMLTFRTLHTFKGEHMQGTEDM